MTDEQLLHTCFKSIDTVEERQIDEFNLEADSTDNGATSKETEDIDDASSMSATNQKPSNKSSEANVYRLSAAMNLDLFEFSDDGDEENHVDSDDANSGESIYSGQLKWTGVSDDDDAAVTSMSAALNDHPSQSHATTSTIGTNTEFVGENSVNVCLTIDLTLDDDDQSIRNQEIDNQIELMN